MVSVGFDLANHLPLQTHVRQVTVPSEIFVTTDIPTCASITEHVEVG